MKSLLSILLLASAFSTNLLASGEPVTTREIYNVDYFFIGGDSIAISAEQEKILKENTATEAKTACIKIYGSLDNCNIYMDETYTSTCYQPFYWESYQRLARKCVGWVIIDKKQSNE